MGLWKTACDSLAQTLKTAQISGSRMLIAPPTSAYTLYGLVYHLILCVPHGILSVIITMERHCGQYSMTNYRMSVRCFRLIRSMYRCVELWRLMCRLSKIDVLTFKDRCADLRDDGCCVDLRRQMIDVKLCCYTCSKHDGIVVCK